MKPPGAAARCLNMLLPGTGLIVAGNPWEGVAVALLFAGCAHPAIAAWLLVPTAWPRFVAWSTLAGTIIVWIAAQWLMRAARIEAQSQITN